MFPFLKRAAVAAGASALVVILSAIPNLLEAAQIKNDQLKPGVAAENDGKVNVTAKGAKCDYNFGTQTGTDDSGAVKRR